MSGPVPLPEPPADGSTRPTTSPDAVPPAGADAPLLIPAPWANRAIGSVIDLVLVYLLPWLASAALRLVVDPLIGRSELFSYAVLNGLGISLWQLILMVGSAGLVMLFIAQLILEGRTGQSVGKKLLGIRVVDARTGRPIGIAMAFARRGCRFLNVLPLGAGFLWPLWDARKQTLADKATGTMVIIHVDPESPPSTAR